MAGNENRRREKTAKAATSGDGWRDKQNHRGAANERWKNINGGRRGMATARVKTTPRVSCGIAASAKRVASRQNKKRRLAKLGSSHRAALMRRVAQHKRGAAKRRK